MTRSKRNFFQIRQQYITENDEKIIKEILLTNHMEERVLRQMFKGNVIQKRQLQDILQCSRQEILQYTSRKNYYASIDRFDAVTPFPNTINRMCIEDFIHFNDKAKELILKIIRRRALNKMWDETMPEKRRVGRPKTKIEKRMI